MDKSLLILAANDLLKREPARVVVATGIIFEKLEEISSPTTLEKALASHRGGTWGEETTPGFGYPVLRSTNMRRARVDVADPAWCDIPEENAKANILETGDILVTKSSGSSDLVGKAALFIHPGDNQGYVFSNFSLRLRPNQAVILPEFLAWFLRSPQSLMWRYASQHTTVGLRNLKTKDFLNQLIPIPELSIQKSVVEYLNNIEISVSKRQAIELPSFFNEQQRIIARVETLAAKVEQAQRLRQRSTGEAEVLIRSASSRLFSKLLSSSQNLPVGRIISFRNDLIRPTDGVKGRIRFIGLQHVESHTGRKIGEDILQAEELTGRKFKFSPGEIVYGYLRPYLNKVWIADCEGTCSVDQYVIRPDEKAVDTNYLAHFMRSSTFLQKANELTNNLMLPRLRTALLESITIPIPPLSEQHRIIVYLDNLQAKVEAVKHHQAATAGRLESLLPSILDRAFRGEL
jgi:restriction endonuclease S subunit